MPYKSLMILIQSNTCRGELSNFVKDVLWYSVIIILYRNIAYVIKILHGQILCLLNPVHVKYKYKFIFFGFAYIG